MLAFVNTDPVTSEVDQKMAAIVHARLEPAPEDADIDEDLELLGELGITTIDLLRKAVRDNAEPLVAQFERRWKDLDGAILWQGISVWQLAAVLFARKGDIEVSTEHLLMSGTQKRSQGHMSLP